MVVFQTFAAETRPGGLDCSILEVTESEVLNCIEFTTVETNGEARLDSESFPPPALIRKFSAL